MRRTRQLLACSASSPEDRRLLFVFLGGTFLWAWALWVPAALWLRDRTGNASPLSLWIVVVQSVGAAAPTLVAILLLRRTCGKRALALSLARLRPERCGWIWYATAILLNPAIVLLSLGLFLATSGRSALQFDTPLGEMIAKMGLAGALAVLPVIYASQLVSSPLLEEFGWRGLALPLLQRRCSAWTSSVLLGAIWWLWHVPLFVLYGQAEPRLLAISWVHMTGLTVLMTMIFNHTAGNVFMAMLWHASLNVAMFLDLGQPRELTAALAAAAAVGCVLVFGRRSLAHQPRVTSLLPRRRGRCVSDPGGPTRN